MAILFWVAAGLIIYTYFGYPAWLWLRCRWFRKPVRSTPNFPSTSIVLAVRNEAAVLRAKLMNLLELDYPAGRAEVIVVSDGSTDETSSILQEFRAGERIHVVLNQASRGKASSLNDAIAVVKGEIVVFVDARQMVDRDALRLLMENFADCSVGCVSGELLLGDPGSGEASRGMGLYWKIEKLIRELESATGSVIGATGALYAVRRDLLVPLAPETILDDVLIPMNVLRQGMRVIFDSRAHAWDVPDLGTKREFSRKVRTLTGNYQLIQLAPWLLSATNPARFSFISHKLLRLFVPLALCLTLVTPVFLHSLFYRAALVAQTVFYGLSVLALIRQGRDPLARVADAALTFVLLNAAAAVAFLNFFLRRRVAWGN